MAATKQDVFVGGKACDVFVSDGAGAAVQCDVFTGTVTTGGGGTPGGGQTGTVVWTPTPAATGTVIGDTADPDWIHVVTNESWATVCPTMWKNAYWGPNGEIVLRIMREPNGITHPRTGTTCYSSGAFIAGMNYGFNWPPQATTSAGANGQQPGTKLSFGFGHRWEAEALWPAKDGAYTCFWLMPTNKSSAQTIVECDWAENRPNATPEAGTYSNLRTVHYTATHWWGPSGEVFASSGGYRTGLTDITQNWHKIAIEVDSAGCRYYVDDVNFRTTLPPRNADGSVQTDVQLGVMINAVIGYPALNFINGYENPLPPDCTSPGYPAQEWYLRVRNMRVLAL